MRWDVIGLVLGWTIRVVCVPLTIVGLFSAYTEGEEYAIKTYLIPLIIAALVSQWFIFRSKQNTSEKRVRDREAFASVALGWIPVIALGSMPFWLGGTFYGPYELGDVGILEVLRGLLYSWFESMSKKFKYDRRKIAQELECDFLGSGDGVIPGDIQENIAKNMIREPIEKYMQATFWQWKEPIIGHSYIMGVDVSRGDSEDFSAISIIDFDDREQVAEYIGKIPPDDLAAVAYKWAILYGNAFIVTDITGGMGVATSRKLTELNYKNVYVEGVNTQNIWDYNAKAMEKIPGLNFNNKRTQIVAAFEEQLRKGFIIRSARLLNELNTFVYLNGRPDHMKGTHDDAIMGLSMALYVADISFNQLEKNENANKAMLESWTMTERTYEPNKSFYSYGTAFDQIGSMGMDNNQIYYQNNPSNVPKEAYKEYSWLFGKSKKSF